MSRVLCLLSRLMSRVSCLVSRLVELDYIGTLCQVNRSLSGRVESCCVASRRSASHRVVSSSRVLPCFVASRYHDRFKKHIGPGPGGFEPLDRRKPLGSWENRFYKGSNLPNVRFHLFLKFPDGFPKLY